MTEQKETDPSAPTTTTIATATAGETRANLFPQYLMKLLNDQVAPDALWWLPDGCAFALDPNKITDQVLDKHFQKTKYSSFIRRLHNEGYRRQTRRYKKVDGLTLPEGTVVLSHDLFQRDKPQLLESFYKKSLEAANTAKSSSSAAIAMNSTAKLQDVKAAKLPRPSHTTTKVPPPVTAAPASFPTLDPLVRAGRQVSDQAAAAAAAALQRLEPLAPGGRQTSDQAAAAMLNFSTLSRLSAATAAGGTFPAPTASLAASLGGGAGGAMAALGSHNNNGLLGASASATSAIGGAGVDAHHHAHLTSLSKSIAELREARLRRELLGNPAAAYPTQILPSHHYQHLHNAAAAANAANLFSSEDAIRHLLLQHGYMQGLSRASSAESGASGNPVGAAPTAAAAAGLRAATNGNANDTAAAAGAGLAPSMSRLQELELETHRRRLQLEAEQQGQRHLTALDALRRAAYFDHHLNR